MQIDKSKIELITIGVIIAMLVIGVVFSFRPPALFREARNATRKNHMELVITAIYTYAIDHGGFFPDCIPEPNEEAVEITECLDQIGEYIKGPFPTDPDPNHRYMIESVPEIEKKIRVFSTAPEAASLEVIQ
ncbi:MAG: hypothetical protein KY054_02310 [Candidatus Nealsonbacteria bacterium]|nr:hypothetical protein [Candidatus Nealsonbacteria bacterium]